MKETLAGHFQEVTLPAVGSIVTFYLYQANTFGREKLTRVVLNRQLWAEPSTLLNRQLWGQFIASVHKVKETLAGHFQEVTLPAVGAIATFYLYQDTLMDGKS